jgi:hypothetical protein
MLSTCLPGTDQCCQFLLVLYVSFCEVPFLIETRCLVVVPEEDISSYWTTLRKRGYSKFIGGALVCTLWRTCFGRGYGPVARHCIVSEFMYSHSHCHLGAEKRKEVREEGQFMQSHMRLH